MKEEAGDAEGLAMRTLMLLADMRRAAAVHNDRRSAPGAGGRSPGEAADSDLDGSDPGIGQCAVHMIRPSSVKS